MARGGSNEKIFSFSDTRVLVVCWWLQCNYATSTAGSAWTARPVRTDRADRCNRWSGTDRDNRRSGADRAAGRHGADRPDWPDRTAGAAHATALVEKHNLVFDTS